MQPTILWQQNSDNPENTNNFAKISKFWTSLHDKKIAWRQRIMPPNSNIREIDWEAQRFDEVFKLQMPQVRGITLYWYKPYSDQERSTTPSKLELDLHALQLYIYPQSQKDLVIRIGIPEIIYQKIEITNPLWESNSAEGNFCLTLRDNQQQIEVKLTLSLDNLANLKELL
ncbi:MAG TPA: hypothetical protein DEG17_22855 [Cyanobacteria bacterium UBA11149]|nr:hypothetical protein [Cyanobacteria bacterium UBA11367]HBE60278.1 hypothetical protein [Cyanobacteria bacterium UBA11366]HBK62095.1 hypothetical protein [Cyanobacteria bacterium UBA11166]HBR74223.1 hypothetical protein [Cyanobacteria bacterium UBA11159]HBS70259.1 hypothetical protein [Cyanobacteria bacterium UBA11153]HBW91623.1 hypothetical protein [Cyanobacteria bacterium UBA11149]HCA93471.1 hypothetical protein [Cyanobacteria bacterium UBA9226]